LFVGQVSARFWLMDCRNVAEATKMATNLYKEAIHVPFMSKFVVFSKRHEQLEVLILSLQINGKQINVHF
jgi:ankyrin